MGNLSYEEFYNIHEHQLVRGIGFPKDLIKDLYEALKFTGGNNVMKETFEIKKIKNLRSILIAKKELQESSCFFLIDHIWTVDSNTAYKELLKSPDLLENLGELFNIVSPGDGQIYLNYSAQNHIVRNVKENGKNVEEIVSKINGDTINAAVGVLDDVSPDDISSDKDTKKKENDYTFEEFKKAMEVTDNIPQNATDAYLYKLYENFMKRDNGQGTTLNYNWMEIEDGVISVYVPIPLSANKKSIKSLLTNTIWSLTVDGAEVINGCFYAAVKQDESFWSIDEPGLFCMSLQKVEEEKTWPSLIKNEKLLSPEEIMLHSWVKETEKNLYIEEILDEMWKYNQTYSCYVENKPQEPKWYIMDRYGSSLVHSKNPNFSCLPFFYAGNGKAYSILWPTKDVKVGEACTRDFIPFYSRNYTESDETYKVNLKVLTEKKLYGKIHIPGKVYSDKQLMEIKCTYFDDSKENEEHGLAHVYSNSFSQLELERLNSKFKELGLLKDLDNNTKQILNISESLISIDGDLCPMEQLLYNKEFLDIYLQYSFEEDIQLTNNSYILPVQSIDFNKDFESSSLPRYWICKPKEKKRFNIKPFISSQYSRILRMAEASHLVVSEYFIYQPTFRNRRFALTFNMIITPGRKLLVHAEPYIRITKNEIVRNSTLNEYDNSATMTQTPISKKVSNQIGWYDEFKISMNKLMLPLDENKGWSHAEILIYQKIGLLGRQIAKDLKFSSDKNYLIFSIDVILNELLTPLICDVNGEPYYPNDATVKDFVELVSGRINSNFVQIE